MKQLMKPFILMFQAIELMVADALLKANDYLDIASHVQDPSQYWKVWEVFTNVLICY